MKENSIPSEYMVRVQCMTYNHAPYIKDALNGFCMQETNFPFICVIVDDASTDGEQEVIRKYLEENFDLTDESIVRYEETNDYVLTLARHKTNFNCYFAALFLKYNHYRKKSKYTYYASWSKAKYIAMCEGDDSWTHPNKIQIQVDVLEKYSECSFCSTGFRKIYTNENRDEDMTIYANQQNPIFWGIEYWSKSIISQTLTVMERNQAYEEYLKLSSKYCRPKDTYHIYHLFKEGICAYIPICMGIYNYNGQGVWSGNSWEEQTKEVLFSYRELYIKNERDKIVYSNYFNYIIESFRFGKINDLKCSFLKEGWSEALSFEDRRKLITAYVNMFFRVLINDFRCKLAIRTRIKRLYSRFGVMG